MALYNFNPGQKSWKMYANTLTSISGDDLTISPVEGRDLILEVSGNEGDIMFRHADTNVLTIDSARATISGDLDVLGDISNTGTISLYDGAVTIGTTPDMLLVKSGTHTVFSVDISNRRVGIGKADPEEDLEIDGNIQLLSSKGNRILFYDNSGQHEHAEIDALGDGTKGGLLQFHTREDNNNGVTNKFTINNIGAFGIADGSSSITYGTQGQVLTSDGSSNRVKWTTPSTALIYAHYSYSETTTISDVSSSSATISGDFTEVFNPNGIISDVSNGIFTIDASGIYQINFGVNISCSGDNINTAEVSLKKNSSNKLVSNRCIQDISQITLNNTTIQSFNQTDTVELNLDICGNTSTTISILGENYNGISGEWTIISFLKLS